ncbi:6623_t:CDS:2, partial [Scutellospora calospora]
PFKLWWWVWMVLTGIGLGFTVSASLDGLSTMAFIGLLAIKYLWDLLCDLRISSKQYAKHFLAKALCLIVIPIILYITFFLIHIIIMKNGSHDEVFVSPEYIKTLNEHSMNDTPIDVAYGSTITLRHVNTLGYLNSPQVAYSRSMEDDIHHQVSLLLHNSNDDNNFWTIKNFRFSENLHEPQDPDEPHELQDPDEPHELQDPEEPHGLQGREEPHELQKESHELQDPEEPHELQDPEDPHEFQDPDEVYETEEVYEPNEVYEPYEVYEPQEPQYLKESQEPQYLKESQEPQYLKEPQDPSDDDDLEWVYDDAVIHLEHVKTGRSLHSNMTKAPVSDVDYQYEVSARSYESFIDTTDLWHIVIADHDKSDPESKKRLRALRTKFRLYNYETGCYLFSHYIKLPSGGSNELEVTCATNGIYENSLWYIETNSHSNLPQDTEMVSYKKLGLLQRFFELNKAMWEYRNERYHDKPRNPLSWLFLTKGVEFWKDEIQERQIYLLGNPFVWWFSTLAVFGFVVAKSIILLLEKRGYTDYLS